MYTRKDERTCQMGTTSKPGDKHARSASRTLYNRPSLRLPTNQPQSKSNRPSPWVKHFAYETRQADHKEQEQDLRERLQRLGVEVSLAHYTGDSSSPTEYELIFGPVRVAGPTMDLAVTAFLQYWIERFGVEALSRSGAHPLYRLGERREESEE